jgi:hypothetical protein
MAKHKFVVGKKDAQGRMIGSVCIPCGKIAIHEDGLVPRTLRDEECKRKDTSPESSK